MSAPVPAVLGIAWGLLLAVPLARRARDREPRSRSGSLGADHRSGSPPARRAPSPADRLAAAMPAPARALGARLLARRRAHAEARTVERELPVTIDLLAVAVRAGCTPFLAVDTAARWAPPALASHLSQVRRACMLGRGFGDALDDLARQVPPLHPLVDALLASDRVGAPVGDALVRLATEQRTVLRRRAEARARTVPVRLLFPLVFLVLPAFGLLTVVPAVLTGLGGP